MLVSVDYPYECEQVIKVHQKFTLKNKLYIVYETDHINIIIVNTHNMVIHEKYDMDKSIVYSHIASDGKIYLMSIYMLYTYSSFDKLKNNNVSNKILLK